MSIYWDTPIDVLMHGGDIEYVDLDEDEVMHWKYIKKEKRPNGKWRYFYKVNKLEDALGVDEKARLEFANSESKRLTEEANEFKDYVRERHLESGQQYGEYRYYSDQEARELMKLTRQQAEKFKEAEEAGRKAVEAAEEFYKTPLGKLDKLEKKIKKGVKAVGKFFSKLFGK